MANIMCSYTDIIPSRMQFVQNSIAFSVMPFRFCPQTIFRLVDAEAVFSELNF